jgi:hypothetical protein
MNVWRSLSTASYAFVVSTGANLSLPTKEICIWRSNRYDYDILRTLSKVFCCHTEHFVEKISSSTERFERLLRLPPSPYHLLMTQALDRDFWRANKMRLQGVINPCYISCSNSIHFSLVLFFYLSTCWSSESWTNYIDTGVQRVDESEKDESKAKAKQREKWITELNLIQSEN